MRRKYNTKIKQSTAISRIVNINLAFRSSCLWSWNETHNYYKREKNDNIKIKQRTASFKYG